MRAVWALLCRNPHTNGYAYLTRLELDVDPNQELGSVKAAVVADGEFQFVLGGPLVGKGIEDFAITLYQLPEWPCERSGVSESTIFNAFAITISDEYLPSVCIKRSPLNSYNEVSEPENLAVVLRPILHPPRTRSQPVQEVTGNQGREAVASAARKRVRPSIAAKAEQLEQIQASTEPDAVYNYRPVSLSGPPVQIYSPVFASFLRAMNEPYEFSHDELDRAHGFVTACSAYYETKDLRVDAMGDMATAVHEDILTTIVHYFEPLGKIRPDGIVRASGGLVGGFRAVRCIHEVRNEIGEDGCDPMAQAERCYASVYSSKQACMLRRVSPCPCILIGTAGPNMTVNGAVFADKIVSQRLTDVHIAPDASTSDGTPLDEAAHRVARLFRALRMALEGLDVYYARFAALSPSSASPTSVAPAPPYISPHFTSFRMDGKNVTLEYFERFTNGNPWRAVFAADAHTDSGTKTTVVVKFAYRYSRAAHELLAQHDPPLAPRLWFCEKVASVGMHVVVTDCIADFDRDSALSAAERASARDAVALLHRHGLVFGDLRRPNVLRRGDGGVRLIDFDWCGKAGEARYPSDINMNEGTDISWHPDVRRGGLIQKEHDVYLLDRLN